MHCIVQSIACGDFVVTRGRREWRRGKMLLIREETPKDHEEVRRVIRRAFENAEHTDHDEHNLVDRLRKSDAFIPELSLVAEMDGKIIGHVLFSKIRIQDTVQVALAPVSVLPELQGRGVGSALIREGHARAAKMGYDFSVVLGHAAYYPRFGYVAAKTFGIRSPFPVPDENHMAVRLRGDVVALEGTVTYPKEFFEA